MTDLEDLRKNSIRWCLDQDTLEQTAEAIAICIANLRDRNDKRVRVYLHPDYEQHIEFCKQIAKQLREAQEK